MVSSLNTNKESNSTAVQSSPPKTAPAPTHSPIPSVAKKTFGSSQLASACPKESQWVIVILLSIAGLLATVNMFGSSFWSTRPSDLVRGELPAYRIDLNEATASELMQLPGIGPKTAERIVSYRREHGKFANVAELIRVPNIGDATVRRLSNWICVNKKTKLLILADQKNNVQNATPIPGKQSFTPQPGKFKLININSATAIELQQLPRIGPVLAERIVAERQNGRFVSIDDLRRVFGIGKKTVEYLRPFVTTGE